MARNQFDGTYTTVALAANTAKTVIGFKAATNVAVVQLEASVSFDGATSSNAPAIVEFGSCGWSTSSPGTNSTSLTLTKREPGRAETLQVTAGHTWTTEPTTITKLRSLDIGQYNGTYHYVHPFTSPQVFAGGTGGVIRITSPNVVNCTGHVTGEE